MAPLVGAVSGVGLGLLDKLAENPAGLARSALQGACVVVVASALVYGYRGYTMEKSGNVPPPTYYAGNESGFQGGSSENAPETGGNSAGKVNGVDPLDKGGNHMDWVADGYKISGAFPSTAANMAKTDNLMREESTYNPNAKAYAPTAYGRAQGAMQIIEPTWRTHAPAGYKDWSKYWMYPRLSVATSLNYQKAKYGYVVAHAPY